MPGVTVPPFHPNCRGTTAPAIDDDLLALDKEVNGGGERAARGEDRKVYNVPGDMTYSEWKKAFVEGGSKEELEEYPNQETPTTEMDTDRPVTEVEIEALDYYASGDGMYINHPLREGQQLSDEDQILVEDLDSATDRPIGEDMVVYRSVSAKAIFDDISETDYENLRSEILYGFKEPLYAKKNEMYLQQAKGKIITEKGYMSTTKDFEIASEFGDFTGAEDPVVIELTVPKTARGIDLTKVDMPEAYKQAELSDPQREILWARGKKYRLNEITKREGNIYIKAEMLEDELKDEVVLAKTGTDDIIGVVSGRTANSSVVSDKSDMLLDDLVDHPEKLGEYTPADLKKALEDAGLDVKPLSDGNFKDIDFEDGGGFKVNFEDGGLLMYHPEERSHHGGAYYKISTGKRGIQHYGTNGNGFKPDKR